MSRIGVKRDLFYIHKKGFIEETKFAQENSSENKRKEKNWESTDKTAEGENSSVTELYLKTTEGWVYRKSS